VNVTADNPTRPALPSAWLTGMAVALMVGGCGKQSSSEGATSTGGSGTSSGASSNGAGASSSGGGSDDKDVPGSDAARGTPIPPAKELCPTWAEATKAGKVNNSKLDEISGLAASRVHEGVLWAHNDSGEDKPRVFAIGSDARHLATFKLKGVEPRDWEDLSVGPCAETGPFAESSCLYVGDVGDNSHKRDSAWIHRVPEPLTLPDTPTGTKPRTERFRKADTESFVVRYPSADHLSGKRKKELEHPDIEAIAVMADTRVLLFSKHSDGGTDVFRATLTQPEAKVERIGVLDLKDKEAKKGHALAVTGADLTANGRWLVIRCYFRIYVFDAGDALIAAADKAPALLAAVTRSTVKSGLDLQGESIAWDPEGGLWHTSEGNHQPLWRIRCGDR